MLYAVPNFVILLGKPLGFSILLPVNKKLAVDTACSRPMRAADPTLRRPPAEVDAAESE